MIKYQSTRFICIILLLFTASTINGEHIRHLSSRDGLSNSSVICLFQDKDRYLWMGTYDGLNRYNGSTIDVYKPRYNDNYSISGNVVRKIVGAKDQYLWILTKGGLNRFSKRRDRIESVFPDFKEDCSMACDTVGNVYVVKKSGNLFYYDSQENRMKEVPIENLPPTKEWINLIIDSDNNVYITSSGVARRYKLTIGIDNKPSLQWVSQIDNSEPVTHVFYDNKTLLFIDRVDNLYAIKNDIKSYITNVGTLLRKYGDISSVIYDKEDIILGFRTSGVVRLLSKDSFLPQRIPINCGVFSLLKDDKQDLLWIATDGQGVYALTKERYRFDGINLSAIPFVSQHPVRAIFSDPHGDLWLGGKGSGIIKIKNYDTAEKFDHNNVECLTIKDGLVNNSVFVLTHSKANNLIWIGTSGPGINYYSYEDNRIHKLAPHKSELFTEVHSILESSDTTLWVSSLFSLYKINVIKKGAKMEIKRTKRFDFDLPDKQTFNKIYANYQVNDSIMWLAMRGNGAIRFNQYTGSYKLITFDSSGFTPVNDILCIHQDREQNLWFGSSYGITQLSQTQKNELEIQNFNSYNSIINNTIHGILENDDNDLWLSSNAGLFLYDRRLNTFRHFNHQTGLLVNEFSDNAYYKDEESKRCFFGGVNGVVWIERGERLAANYQPPILFTKLQLLNTTVDMDDYLVNKNGEEYLELKHNQSFFTISYSINDFINTGRKKISYMLENYTHLWTSTDMNDITFAKIPHGEYLLRIKYGDRFSDAGIERSLKIIVLPPWWLTTTAKIIYAIVLVVGGFFIYLYILARLKKSKQKILKELSQKNKEKIYENKLQFFTNVTHEFCTPLTLIITPSERILNYKGSDDVILKYAQIIKTNADRLNVLIQDIIDFRRVETGNKVIKINEIDINTLCQETTQAFIELAIENKINFSFTVQERVVWNTDANCLRTILNNLLSNAFKYTPLNGEVSFSVETSDNRLVMIFTNSCKGIKHEDIDQLFKSYKVLDNVERNSKGTASSNGLGLAICKSIVELLGGTIGVESDADQFVKFTVLLPNLEIPQASGQAFMPLISDSGNNQELPDASLPEIDPNTTILIVDDNQDILWTLKNILSDNYNVITASDGEEGLQQVISHMPDLIITDIMMPISDGIVMTKKIKHNPHTMHIPIIIISAKSSDESRFEGIESGADAYITKPFDVHYLKVRIRQLIVKHKQLKEYYNSAASAYNYVGGQLLSNEGRDFINTVIDTIEQNLNDPDFSPEDLAERLCVSLRTLYRKLKEFGMPAPKDLIRKQRIEYSAKLLTCTQLSIQEIMYAAGFSTRSHFHKEFVKKYNQSPKFYREAISSRP